MNLEQNLDNLSSTDDLDISPEAMANLEVLLIDGDIELQETLEELEGISLKVNTMESAICELENISAIITEYGISKPMMLMVDQEKGFVKAGIISDYEEMGNTPTHDDVSKQALANIDEVIAASTEGLFDMIGNLFSKIGKSFARFFKTINGQIDILQRSQKSIKEKGVDAGKFAAKKGKVPPIKNLMEFYKASEVIEKAITSGKMSGMIEAVEKKLRAGDTDVSGIYANLVKEMSVLLKNPMIKETWGMEITYTTYGITVTPMKKAKGHKNFKKKTMTENGYDPKKVDKLIVDTIKTLGGMKKVSGIYDKFATRWGQLDWMADTGNPEIQGIKDLMSDGRASEVRSIMRAIQKMIELVGNLAWWYIQCNKRLTAYTRVVAKAAVSSKA